MSNDTLGPHDPPIVINISPKVLLNKNKKTSVVKETCSTVCGLLNSHYGGILKLISSESLTPAILDEFVRAIEQTLIEHLGLTGLLEYCQTEIVGLGKEIIFTVKPSDRVCTVEYNLVLPTDFLVKQVLRTEPLEKIAQVLKPGRPLVNVNLQNHMLEFVKESTMPADMRESDTIQFKKLKSDKNKNKSIADRIIANKIAHYIAAFANHKGGHVYIGIDDETYKVCGQIVVEEERQRIVEKVGLAVANMVWPEEHGEPELGKHWDISFVPVLDANKEAIPDLFVIVIAIACCPGGVFLGYPEAYEINNGEVVRMQFKRWKKRLLHDAHMRDIVQFCRDNSWKRIDTRQVAEGEQSETGLPKQDGIFAVRDAGSSSIPFAIPKLSPRNTKSRNFCRRITDYMEQLIQDGDFDKLQTFASKMCSKEKAFHKADIKVAVHFMLALGAYRRRKFVEAYDELDKASSSITLTENAGEFEVQKLHLLACFRRGESQYDTSYEVTYGVLQEIEGMSPGWHTAWVLNDAGYLFSILAGEERNQEVRKSLKQQAILLYTKAIDHTSAIREELNESDQASVLRSNLLHRCHLRRAMLSLGCKPLAEEDDANQEVTNEEIEGAISSILMVEESSLKGDSLTDVNECYLYLVKSDLNYRRSQLNEDHCEKFTKTARDWATKARDLAAKDQFCGITEYAQSRIDLLTKVHCCSSVEEKLFADLDDYEKCQP